MNNGQTREREGKKKNARTAACPFWEMPTNCAVRVRWTSTRRHNRQLLSATCAGFRYKNVALRVAFDTHDRRKEIRIQGILNAYSRNVSKNAGSTFTRLNPEVSRERSVTRLVSSKSTERLRDSGFLIKLVVWLRQRLRSHCSLNDTSRRIGTHVEIPALYLRRQRADGQFRAWIPNLRMWLHVLSFLPLQLSMQCDVA